MCARPTSGPDRSSVLAASIRGAPAGFPRRFARPIARPIARIERPAPLSDTTTPAPEPSEQADQFGTFDTEGNYIGLARGVPFDPSPLGRASASQANNTVSPYRS